MTVPKQLAFKSVTHHVGQWLTVDRCSSGLECADFWSSMVLLARWASLFHMARQCLPLGKRLTEQKAWSILQKASDRNLVFVVNFESFKSSKSSASIKFDFYTMYPNLINLSSDLSSEVKTKYDWTIGRQTLSNFPENTNDEQANREAVSKIETRKASQGIVATRPSHCCFFV